MQETRSPMLSLVHLKLVNEERSLANRCTRLAIIVNIRVRMRLLGKLPGFFLVIVFYKKLLHDSEYSRKNQSLVQTYSILSWTILTFGDLLGTWSFLRLCSFAVCPTSTSLEQDEDSRRECPSLRPATLSPSPLPAPQQRARLSWT